MVNVRVVLNRLKKLNDDERYIIFKIKTFEKKLKKVREQIARSEKILK